MITGSNDVYTPVDAYGVVTYADSGIISGGNSGNEVITGSTRFFWIYDPSDPFGKMSGFTGLGWFEDIKYSPIGYYMDIKNFQDINQLINSIFGDSGTNNLNDVFTMWQSYVSANSGAVGKFIADIIIEGGEAGKNCYQTY